MASKGLTVKAVGFQPQADDFLGQIIQGGIAEPPRLKRLQVIVQNGRVGDRLPRQRRSDGVDGNL